MKKDRKNTDETNKEANDDKRMVSSLIMRIIPNISIVLSLMSLTFLIINIFNRSMNFANSELSHFVFILLGFSSLITSFLAIYYDRKLYKISKENEDQSDKNKKGRSRGGKNDHRKK